MFLLFPGHKETIAVTSIVGDLTKAEQVLAAFEGVTCVIHTAALVSVGTFPDVEAMQRVNVDGAKKTSRKTLMQENCSCKSWSNSIDKTL